MSVTECPIEHPKKQRKYYSGKKKRHTIKAQVIADRNTGIILCTAESQGRTHDFALYKNSIGNHILDSIKAQADSGYQGLSALHKNSETPKKNPKGGKLTDIEKKENQRISRERILIENINAKIKVLRL